MGCCGDNGHGSHGDGKQAAGGMNWVQIVALGLIALLVLGFVIGR